MMNWYLSRCGLYVHMCVSRPLSLSSQALISSCHNPRIGDNPSYKWSSLAFHLSPHLLYCPSRGSVTWIEIKWTQSKLPASQESMSGKRTLGWMKRSGFWTEFGHVMQSLQQTVKFSQPSRNKDMKVKNDSGDTMWVQALKYLMGKVLDIDPKLILNVI